MNEQEKKKYLEDRKKKTVAPLKTWSPKFTPEEQAAHDKYVKDNNLPF